VEARYRKEESASVGREAVRVKAKAGGDLAAARFGRGRLEDLRAAHEKVFPTCAGYLNHPSQYE